MATTKTMTKTELVKNIKTKLSLSGIELKLEEIKLSLAMLVELVIEELKGKGLFVLPGVVKLTAVHKPAQPARQGVNPFTKEPTMLKAKPAARKVKATPVKALRDAAEV